GRMPPAEWNQVFAPPSRPPAINPNVERIVLVHRPGPRPEHDFSTERSMSKGKILILSTDEHWIKSADLLNQFARDGHVPGRAKIPKTNWSGDSGYDTVVNPLSESDERFEHCFARKANRTDDQRLRPSAVSVEMSIDEVAPHHHIVVNKQ